MKGVNLFKTVNVPILGMVRNMSLFTCPSCGSSTHVFGERQGVQKTCEDLGIGFLGDIPLHQSICDDADRGVPTVVAEPESERASAFQAIARVVGERIGLL